MICDFSSPCLRIPFRNFPSQLQSALTFNDNTFFQARFMMSHKDDIPRSVFFENAADLELLFLLRLVFISKRRIHKWEIEIFAQKEGSG